MNTTNKFITDLRKLLDFDVILEIEKVVKPNNSRDNKSSILDEMATYLEENYSAYDLEKWKAVLSGAVLVLKAITNLCCVTFLFRSAVQILRRVIKSKSEYRVAEPCEPSYKTFVDLGTKDNDSLGKYALMTSILFLVIISYAFEVIFYITVVSFARFKHADEEKYRELQDQPTVSLTASGLLGTMAVRIIKNIGIISRSRSKNTSYLMRHLAGICDEDNGFLTTARFIENGHYFSLAVLSNVSACSMTVNALLVIFLIILMVFETKIDLHVQNVFEHSGTILTN